MKMRVWQLSDGMTRSCSGLMLNWCPFPNDHGIASLYGAMCGQRSLPAAFEFPISAQTVCRSSEPARNGFGLKSIDAISRES